MITYRQLDISEVGKIAEIDRSEHIILNYRSINGSLEEFPVDWQVPRWHSTGEGGHSVAVRVKGIGNLLRHGATMIGALDGDLLVGFAVICYRLREDMAQLDALFVSRAYRRQGIAEHMVAESRSPGSSGWRTPVICFRNSFAVGCGLLPQSGFCSHPAAAA
jgi:hypothetical protein